MVYKDQKVRLHKVLMETAFKDFKVYKVFKAAMDSKVFRVYKELTAHKVFKVLTDSKVYRAL